MARMRPEQIRAGRRPGPGFGLSRIQKRTKRRETGRYILHRNRWIDPYPHVLGTFPEKLVFAYLAKRNIPFTFQATLPDYSGTISVEDFRPDFLLEHFKVIIEVQGMYWHSMPDQAEHDAWKFTIYEAMGYKVYWLWEDDILDNLARLMYDIVEIRGWIGDGDWVWEQQIDDLAALRRMNAGSRKPPAISIRR